MRGARRVLSARGEKPATENLTSLSESWLMLHLIVLFFAANSRSCEAKFEFVCRHVLKESLSVSFGEFSHPLQGQQVLVSIVVSS